MTTVLSNLRTMTVEDLVVHTEWDHRLQLGRDESLTRQMLVGVICNCQDVMTVARHFHATVVDTLLALVELEVGAGIAGEVCCVLLSREATLPIELKTVHRTVELD